MVWRTAIGMMNEEGCILVDVSVNHHHLTNWWLEPRKVCEELQRIPVRGALGQPRLDRHTMRHIRTLARPPAAAHKPIVVYNSPHKQTHTNTHTERCT